MFDDLVIKEVITEIKKCDSYKNELKKYKIFTQNKLDYQKIYDNTSKLIESYKKYFRQFDH
ncbi:MAG TPA: hypothetical protein DDY89_15240, partial [Lysinibacillus sp.]|nr:hypothetical protein [Lysinibacillus sp.]